MILDTNAVSALLAGEPALLERLATAGRLHLPVPVVGEYRYGLLRSNRRRSLAVAFETLIETSNILVAQLETATHYAEIRDQLRGLGRPIPENDLWIAALARQHELAVLTRDTHFDLVPRLKRIGW